MSEKLEASIKMLARYEPDTVYIGTGEYVADCVRSDDGDYYLAADVDATIEALRAEVGRDKALLQQALEVLSRTRQKAMEQAVKARIIEGVVFAEIFQDLDFVVAALEERLDEGVET